MKHALLTLDALARGTLAVILTFAAMLFLAVGFGLIGLVIIVRPEPLEAEEVF